MPEPHPTERDLLDEATRRNRNDGSRSELSFASFPQELKDRPQWVCWKWAVRKDQTGTSKLTKEPYDPRGMRKAKAGDPSTWGSYQEAVRTWLAQDLGGIGFEFSDERDVTGADFDHVLVGGTIQDPGLAAMITNAGTYVEVSPSGDGLHLFSLCGKPDGKTRCKRGDYEMYDHGRFFTVTGNVFDGHSEIADVRHAIERIYDVYLDDSQKAQPEAADAIVLGDTLVDDVDPGEGRPYDPAIIYDKLCGTRSDKLQALLHGDISGYPSHSEADLALCNYIIFYAGYDMALIDAIFRMTALYRPEKWDKADSGSTHGMRTIGKAVSKYRGDLYCWSGRPISLALGRSTPIGEAADGETTLVGTDGQQASQAGRFALPETIAEGEARDVLFRYCCHLRAMGYHAEDILIAASDANSARCEKPLDGNAIAKVVRGSTKYPRGGDHELADSDKSWAAGMSWHASYFDENTNRFMHEVLAEDVMREAHAMLIDGSPAIFAGGLWRCGYAPMERLCSDVQPRLTSAQRNEVIKDISLRPHASSPDDFDGRCYVAFANGVLCVETGDFVDPRPSMYVMGRLPIDFDPNAPAGLTDEFLDSVTDGDAERRQVLEEFVGQCMCARRVIRQSLMLTRDVSDEKRNASTGKSTFLGFVTALLGDDNVASLRPSILGDRFQAVQLVGRLANIAADIPSDELSGKSLAMFKCLVTGDTVYTDVKNKQGFVFRPHATLAFGMNVVPRFSDTTDGVWRRLCFVPFSHHFKPGAPEYDPNMDKRLARPENLQRLALLGVNALCDAIGRGTDTYSRCEAGEIVKQRVVTENDSVLMWVAVERPQIVGRTPVDRYGTYLEWCKRIGIAPVSIGQFTPRVNKHCGTRTQANNSGRRVFYRKTA